MFLIFYSNNFTSSTLDFYNKQNNSYRNHLISFYLTTRIVSVANSQQVFFGYQKNRDHYNILKYFKIIYGAYLARNLLFH
jgi:hypothetical protein